MTAEHDGEGYGVHWSVADRWCGVWGTADGDGSSCGRDRWFANEPELSVTGDGP